MYNKQPKMAMSDVCPYNTWSSGFTIKGQTQISQKNKLQAAV